MSFWRRLALPSFCMDRDFYGMVRLKDLCVVTSCEVSSRSCSIVLRLQLGEGYKALTLDVAVWMRTALNCATSTGGVVFGCWAWMGAL